MMFRLALPRTDGMSDCAGPFSFQLARRRGAFWKDAAESHLKSEKEREEGGGSGAG